MESAPLNAQLTASTTYSVITKLSAQLDHPVTIKLSRINAGGAWAMPHRWRDDAVHVGPALLAAPQEVQAQVAAHEVGHLVAGHSVRLVALIVTILVALSIPVVVPLEAGWVTTRPGLTLLGNLWTAWAVLFTISAYLVWARVCSTPARVEHADRLCSRPRLTAPGAGAETTGVNVVRRPRGRWCAPPRSCPVKRARRRQGPSRPTDATHSQRCPDRGGKAQGGRAGSSSWSSSRAAGEDRKQPFGRFSL